MKKVAILQSSYIPWKGYFDIIHDVDLFVFLDDVQYTPRDWRNRNQIKTKDGLIWFTIPVGNDRNRLIEEVEISDHQWQSDHWKKILYNYKKCKYFQLYEEFFYDVYINKRWESLSKINQYLITEISKKFLDISTDFINSSEIVKEGNKQDALISILKKTDATHYISGPAAKSYITENDFEKNNIKVIWKDYSNYPEYKQNFLPFVHNVSIIDLLFNEGNMSSYYIWGWRNCQTGSLP